MEGSSPVPWRKWAKMVCHLEQLADTEKRIRDALVDVRCRRAHKTSMTEVP